jgi:NADH pyrophosphatase NudC (nudix superfamily)
MLSEKGMTIVEVRNALSVPQNTKQVSPPKTQNNIGKTNKYCTNCGMTNHNVETCRKKE